MARAQIGDIEIPVSAPGDGRQRGGIGPVAKFEIVERRKGLSALVCGSKSWPYIDSILGMVSDFVDHLGGISFAAALQVGIDQEIHGVELVAFAAHAHRSGFASGGDGGEVRVDVVLPEADAGEDVRRHVQRVRRGGSDLRITARGGNAELRQLRFVVAVDQVVRDSRMVGFGGEKFFENGSSLLCGWRRSRRDAVRRLAATARRRRRLRDRRDRTRTPSSSRRNRPVARAAWSSFSESL